MTFQCWTKECRVLSGCASSPLALHALRRIARAASSTSACFVKVRSRVSHGGPERTARFGCTRRAGPRTYPCSGPGIRTVVPFTPSACESRVLPTRRGTFRPRSAMQESSIDTSRLMNKGSPLVVATWLQSPMTFASKSPSSSARLRLDVGRLRPDSTPAPSRTGAPEPICRGHEISSPCASLSAAQSEEKRPGRSAAGRRTAARGVMARAGRVMRRGVLAWPSGIRHRP